MKKRKILSLLLSLCLLIGLLPTAALAADQTNDGAGIRIQYVDGSYDKTTGIMKVRVQAKLPVGTGISSIGTLLSYDNTKLAVVNKNNTKKDVTSEEGVLKETEAIISQTLIQTVDDDENTKEYTLQDSAMYKAGDRSGIYTFHYNGKPGTQKATDAQTSGDWFDVYEVMFRVTGKPDDPAAVLDNGSLRIADVAKGDDAVIKGAHPANNIYSIYLTDDSTPAKLYVLNRMSGCTATEVTGEKSLMTAPETGTATYPGSTNSPSATTYTVTVQNDGNGTASASPATAAAGTEITLSATANSGYHFKEWQVVSGTVTIAGNKFNMPSSNVTVKAIFEADATTTYTVTFEANGGTASETSKQTGADGKLASLPTASRSRYSFDGWYTAASDGTQITTAYVFSANTTVYAHWTYTGGGGGGGSYTPSYTVSVDKTENGTITVSPKSASKGDTVTITVKPDKGYELDTLKVLDKNGDKVKLTEKNGKYTFKMPSGKVTIKASFVEEVPEQIFKDVPANAYYYEAVKWAQEKGITGGIGNGLFGPNDPCTRAQIVTFLWRAAGSPEPETRAMPFTDIPVGSYYYDAVLWAVENDITKGTSDTTFSPNMTCTRAQIVAFLWRSEKSPAAGTANPFADVKSTAYYADAVLWAAKEDITKGTTNTTFSPGADCTRAQIVTFLWRCKK